jgi:hypothetical protein
MDCLRCKFLNPIPCAEHKHTARKIGLLNDKQLELVSQVYAAFCQNDNCNRYRCKHYKRLIKRISCHNIEPLIESLEKKST